MFTAEIRFPLTTADRAAATDAILDLLSAWYQNGQIVNDDWPLHLAPDELRAFISLPLADALNIRYDNIYATSARERLGASGIGDPIVTVLGADAASGGPCVCSQPSHFILYTHYLSSEQPLRCGDCFRPFPLCIVPHIDDHEHLIILKWAADYRACDTLQSHCRTGERFAEQQLFRHDSQLNRWGRRIASEIEVALNRPVFYYLMKVRGRSLSAERKRRCPACGGDWRVPETLYSHFDFRCEPCRLLSNLAFNVT